MCCAVFLLCGHTKIEAEFPLVVIRTLEMFLQSKAIKF